MSDIFATFTYACEKISENGPHKAGAYNSVKRIVTECTIAFESKHGSIENVPAVQYHLNEIEELYALIDNGLVCVDLGIRDLIEKHLFQNLMHHVKELEKIYLQDNR